MVDVMQTSTGTLLRQRVKACISRLNEYARTEGAVIPLDWYNYINLDTLNIEIPYYCVFGQLFRNIQLPQAVVDKYRTLHGYSPTPGGGSGYSRGLAILVPASCDRSNEWAIDHGLATDSFIEQADTYTNAKQWADLTSIWIDEIGKARVFASTAEGMSIMTESEDTSG